MSACYYIIYECHCRRYGGCDIPVLCSSMFSGTSSIPTSTLLLGLAVAIALWVLHRRTVRLDTTLREVEEYLADETPFEERAAECAELSASGYCAGDSDSKTGPHVDSVHSGAPISQTPPSLSISNPENPPLASAVSRPSVASVRDSLLAPSGR